MTRIPYETMKNEFVRVLEKNGFEKKRAELSARLFAEASRDGVYTHGLNRFPGYIGYVTRGLVDPNADPVKAEGFGSLERWEGNRGPGNLNAWFCMGRAVELARSNGIGCVALRNTFHWIRPGAYGLRAAEEGCVGICWTNTVPNMPPWGAKEPKLGNNPLVIAVPRPGNPLLLDMAMTQFAYGKLESNARKGEPLPVPGGFDENGNLTTDAGAVLKTYRAVPVGYWKGSGLSLLLDMVAVVLSGGASTLEAGRLAVKEDGKFVVEQGISQVFIAFDASRLSGGERILASIEASLDDVRNAEPVSEGTPAHYPGEGMLRTRQENLEKGIPVEDVFWNRVLGM